MNDPFSPRPDIASPGAVLARARIAHNLSVIEVARHLKLTPQQVEALEEGDFRRLPGRVFVRGFIKNYAKLVRLDPTPLLRQIEQEIPKPAPVAELRMPREVPLPVQKKSQWPVFAGVAFMIVAALAVYEFGFNDERGDGTGNGGAKSEVTEAAPPGTSGSTPAASGDTAATSAIAPTAPVAALPVTAPTPAAPPAAAPAAPTPPGAAAPAVSVLAPPVVADAQSMMKSPPARAGDRQLLFRFEDDSWVEIRDRDNRIIHSKLNRAGSEERVTGAPPFKLVVGNARKVHLLYDAKPVDLVPHTGVTVARLTIE